MPPMPPPGIAGAACSMAVRAHRWVGGWVATPPQRLAASLQRPHACFKPGPALQPLHATSKILKEATSAFLGHTSNPLTPSPHKTSQTPSPLCPPHWAPPLLCNSNSNAALQPPFSLPHKPRFQPSTLDPTSLGTSSMMRSRASLHPPPTPPLTHHPTIHPDHNTVSANTRLLGRLHDDALCGRE